MKLDDALTEVVNGARMTAPHMQTGCYIEHSFTRGFVRCWPVDRIEDEPNRTQCEFRANDDDRAADWIEVERPALAVDHSPRDAWGKTTPAAIVSEANATAEAFAALVTKELAPMRGDRHEEAQALIDSAKPATTWGEVFADKTPVAGGWRTPEVAPAPKQGYGSVSFGNTACACPTPPDVPKSDGWGVPKV